MLTQRRTMQAAFESALQRRADGRDTDGASQANKTSVGQQIQGGDADELPLQRRLAIAGPSVPSADATIVPVNNTGMPGQLKMGIEALSGMDMSSVRVRRNSAEPAQLNAWAYAQGNDIHLGPGQERHLPHEAWHVVQQRQGRVSATRQAKGVLVNEDPELEAEADTMGARAVALGNAGVPSTQLPPQSNGSQTVQKSSVRSAVRQYAYQQRAEAFEGYLGKYAFTHPVSTTSAQVAIDAMKQVTQVTAHSQTSGQVFGGDDPRYPGNVGRDAACVLEAIDHGNLRERMTGFYNAALGPFKKMLSDRINGVGPWEGNWVGARADLGGRGLNAQALTNIDTRRAQITGSYYNTVPFSSKMKDLYVAPGDIKTRSGDDALYRGQSLIKSWGPRVEAMEQSDSAKLNALAIEGMHKLTFTDADLVGANGASFGNLFSTSTYLKLRDALRALRVTRTTGIPIQSAILRDLNNVRALAKTWLDDHAEEKDVVSSFRKIHGDALTKMETLAQEVTRAMYLLPDSLRAGPDGEEEDLEWVEESTFASLNADAVAIDRTTAGDHTAFLNDASGANAYGLVVDKVRELSGTHGMRHKVRVLHDLNNMVVAWRGRLGGSADDRLLATANIKKTNENLKKRVLVERLQRQLEQVYSRTTRRNDQLRVPGQASLHAGLSLREKTFMQQHDARFTTGSGVFDDTAPLPWEEGGTRYKPNLANTWMNEAANTLKMPVVSGPSGTTDRMFQALHFLGNPVPADNFRLALLGWMLSSEDHSFHEIMAVAKTYGCAYVPGPKSYRDVAPLTETELRRHVCLEPGYLRLFPDEADYHYTLDHNGFALYAPSLASMNANTAHSPLMEAQTGEDAVTYNASHKPKLLRNVTAYTTTAYAIQNWVADDSEFVARRKIDSTLKTARSNIDLATAPRNPAQTLRWNALSWAEQHVIIVLSTHPRVTVDQLYEESKRHNEFTDEAMKQLPTYAGVAWRGESIVSLIGGLGDFDVGKSFTISKFMSASKHDASADAYAKKSRGIYTVGGVEHSKWHSGLKVPVILEINATTAREVDSVSINESANVRLGVVAPQTAEVVFLPGATFTVTAGPHTVAGKTAQVVGLDQT